MMGFGGGEAKTGRRAARALAALGVAASLLGCSAGGPRPDSFAPDYAASVEPAFGYDAYGRYAFGHDGARLRMFAYPAVDARDRPVPPKLVLVAVHGYGEHATLTYGDVAESWAEKGVTTYAYDQRGFGKNVSRGAWPGGDALVKDLAYVVRAARKAHPNAPLGIIGHSMGGAVTMTALGEDRVPEADAAVLLAPASLGGDQLADYVRAFLWVYTAMAPDERIAGSGLGAVTLSDNPEALAELEADPHYLASGSPREYLGNVRLMDRAVVAAETVRTPVLVVWGAKDEIMPGAAVRAAFAKIPGEKRYLELPEGYHLLIRDNVGPEARAAALDFLLETAPAAHAER
ncbi:MAG: alpha/beta fold hydrolase [Pseudomonadota bacterium]